LFAVLPNLDFKIGLATDPKRHAGEQIGFASGNDLQTDGYEELK
jgi:hypothetical protein